MVLENKNLQVCKKCLYSSNHPLGITFDENGICSGCSIHKEKDTLNWNQRFKILERIVKPYRSKKNYYDCIVPVDGSHDSHYIVHVVKKLLKLNPLLVTYNKYYNTDIGVRNLSNLRVKFDTDILFLNVNPDKVKKITKYTLTKFGNIYWHCIAGQTVFPVQISVKYKIPLIIWGAHQGIEQVGMFSYQDEVEMTRRYRKDHDLFGIEADDLVQSYNNINHDDIFEYIYPSFKELNKIGTRGIYLNNYIRWDPKAQNELMIKKYNYKTIKLNRSFDKYEYIDCFNYLGIHDYLKKIKHGYSKVTDQAIREIRFNRLKRTNAIQLIKHYESQKIKNQKQFADWIGMDESSLKLIMHSFKQKFDAVNFYKNRNNNFNLTKSIRKFEKTFFLNPNKKNYQYQKYITFGKGFN